MGYDYSSRTQLASKYLDGVKKKISFMINFISENERKVVDELIKYSYNTYNCHFINKVVADYSEQVPSEYIKANYKNVVKLMVPKECQKDFYYIIDKYNKFQYSEGYDRRSVRTIDYKPSIRKVFALMDSYKWFGIFNCSISDYMLNNLSPEMLDYKQNRSDMRSFDDILAARIDVGDTAVKQSIIDIIQSENNTGVVTTDIIRAIVKSSDTELHKLLCDFMLAAKLQEGVRQAVCENADCGTIEAFILILNTIYDNDLIRFASVKRAIATWTGICSHDHLDRISNKILEDMIITISDKKKAYEYIGTNDSIHIMIGLWALGCYEIKDSIEAMKACVDNGTRNQLLTMSYFNRSVDDYKYCNETSLRIIEKYSDDLEIVAAFMPTYLSNTDTYARRTYDDKTKEYQTISVTHLYESNEQAYKHYEIMKNILENIPKKSIEYSPCIFPWYSVKLEKSNLIVRMAVTAYALGDNDLIDYVCTKIPNIDGGYYYNRGVYVRMLLHNPATDIQRKALLGYVGDKESCTREAAYDIVDSMNLIEEDYSILEALLKYKSTDIRQNALNILKKLRSEQLFNCVDRLISGNKEEIRLGGLDLIAYAKSNKEIDASQLITLTSKISTPTESEQILIEEISGKGKAGEVLSERGFGLYNPDVKIPTNIHKPDISVVNNYFNISKKELDKIFDKLTAFIDKHSGLEYTDHWGDERLLGNALNVIKGKSYSAPYHESHPFPELWKEFYETEIKDERILMNMYIAIQDGLSSDGIEDYITYLTYEKKIFGEVASDYSVSNNKYVGRYARNSIIGVVINILISMYDVKLPYEVCTNLMWYITENMPKEALWYKKILDYRYRSWFETKETAFTKSNKFSLISNELTKWKTDEEFIERFNVLYRVDEVFKFNEKKEYHGSEASTYEKLISDCENTISYHRDSDTLLSVYYYIKAYELNVISEDMVYKAIFEDIGLCAAIKGLSIFNEEKIGAYQLNTLNKFTNGDGENRGSNYYKIGLKFYNNIINKILDVELKRGDSPTVFSPVISYINKILGADRLVAILTALGKEKLDRKTYYGSNGTGKKECLSKLLKVCYPLETDNVDTLKALIKKTNIKEDRLIETAMYSPQWLDIIEEYLNYDGFKSGCYYFMAHMNERFDDKKTAMIAKYTPLSTEELNNGAFDFEWFNEVYNRLGEDRIDKLYASAKYISDGAKHSRARKYADAALDKVSRDDLEVIISDKRNKDLFMSYGIIPIRDKADMLHRYEYIQKFLKESKQFGAQRRASEAAAVDVALKNMATVAGYTDVTRLILAMEIEIVKANSSYFEGYEIEGYQFKISVNSIGKAELIISKNDKTLKSVPTSLKKNEKVLEIKEFQKKLKDQYSRTVKMLEQAMEEEEYYTFEELVGLLENPVTREIINKLVFISEDASGFIGNKGLVDYNNSECTLKADARVRVAHPHDLYKSGNWHEYQNYLFEQFKDSKIKQPFKQVFRELYVKLPEEADKYSSLMFAGNQIQPQKTVGALKNRRWIADYEEGLQKVYYKENIIARIYAMADWFSPSEVEAPTLEWVEFSDRKTFKAIKIAEVPDIIYSEVMRDVDLAVSVAHAGGVDPETSHSTVEMRKVIAEFNMQLFGLSNVTFEKNHAMIKGTKATYSIHLGSGVIHQMGGPQINVLPVHSQSRGKIFLPFIDEDPKNAEITSKILLFAQDNKIKDPYILSQIIIE